MKDNTWGRAINPNKNPEGRRFAFGSWHWMIMERDRVAMTFCRLFAQLEDVQFRGGFDEHVQHRCHICETAWRYFLGFDGKSMEDLKHHEHGWNSIPTFDGQEPVIHQPFSRKIKQATKHQQKMEEQREPTGIKIAFPKLRKQLRTGTLPILVEYIEEDGGEFFSWSPVAADVVVSALTLSKVLEDVGVALENQLA